MSTSRPAKAGYHHGELRETLVAAGLAILEEGGDPASLGLREAARRAGVSAMAPYRHFSDKDALLAAVATVGFDRLRVDLEAADQGESSGSNIEERTRQGASPPHCGEEGGGGGGSEWAERCLLHPPTPNPSPPRSGCPIWVSKVRISGKPEIRGEGTSARSGNDQASSSLPLAFFAAGLASVFFAAGFVSAFLAAGFSAGLCAGLGASAAV